MVLLPNDTYNLHAPICEDRLRGPCKLDPPESSRSQSVDCCNESYDAIVHVRHMLAAHRASVEEARAGVASDRLVDPWELLLLVLVLCAYGLWGTDSAADDFRTINIAGPSALIAILLAGAWWQTQRDPSSIWQPLFWFRIACAAYYGVGALAHYIGNDATTLAIVRFYTFGDADAFKVGLINVLCILTVLATAAVISRRRWIPPKRQPQRSSQRWTLLFASILLAGGGAVRYLVVLPWMLGLSDDILVSTLLMPLARSYIIGLYLLVLAGLRGNLSALLLSLVLVPLDMAISLLTFAKSEVLTTLIFVYLAVLHHKLSLPRIAAGLAIIIGIYSQLDPIIHYGRDELWRQTRSTQGTLEQRLNILSLYTGTEWQGTERADQQSALTRLSYVNVEAMVVNLHDAGSPGDSLDYLLIVLVPRFLWPDKPIITGVGTELYTLATGSAGTSSISPGLFAEAYWNFGWLGIPILMIPLGVMLAVFSFYSLRVLSTENWLHLPIVLMGVQIATRVDGAYVADIVGATATALVLGLFLKAVEPLVRPRSGTASR